ncbi:MAG: glycosyltransferase [Actinobacteria bacterium]|nr:glycosyltransferase [Actinomycetota bacterium]
MSGIAPVTVLIPARNEELDIERCLDAVLAQDLPLDGLEVVVVDGGSSDRTAEIARARLAGAGLRRSAVVVNEGATTPSNLNAGLAEVRTAIVCRVDARSIIPAHYVRLCAADLAARQECAVVGGSQRAVAPHPGATGRGIARALNNRFGMGLARYRRRARSGPTDTVYLGAFRTEQLRGIGGWDERLVTNQDFDLNQRLSRFGQVWFDERLEVGYVPRASVRALWSQYHRFGRWKVRYWRMAGDRPKLRQSIPIVGVPAWMVAMAAVTRLRPSRVVAAGVAVGVVAIAVEAGGASDHDAGGLAVRLVSLAALGAVWTGWLSGVYRELAIPTGWSARTLRHAEPGR